jgi:hypothetical protein
MACAIASPACFGMLFLVPLVGIPLGNPNSPVLLAIAAVPELGMPLSAIAAIVLGRMARRRDRGDERARLGVLMGYWELGAIVLLLLIAIPTWYTIQAAR